MRRRSGAVAFVAGAVLLGGGVTWASDGATGSYRTATAVTADVESTLSVSGTVASSARRDLSFGVAGTIDKVAVAVGDPVASGDELVALDPEELDATVTRAVADLARAKAQLEADQIAQTATVTAAIESSSAAPDVPSSTKSSEASDTKTSDTGTSDTGTSDTGTSGSGTSGSGGAGDGSDGSSAGATELEQVLSTLAKQQKAVTAAQSAATEAIAAARAALEVQAAACVIGDVPGGEDPDEHSTEEGGEDDRADGDENPEDAEQMGGESPEPGTGEESRGDTGANPVTPVPTECTNALAAVQARQDEVADRQATLQTALIALTDTLSDAIAQLSESASAADQGHDQDQNPAEQSEPTPQSGNAGPDSGAPADKGQAAESSPSGRTDTGGGGQASGEGSAGASAGSIASDQAAIDTAEAALTQARLARDSATMTAPFDGTVLDIGFRSGDDVAATDVAVVIVGDGGTTVTTTVTIEQVAQVSKGQSAHVVPAGADEPIEGIVTQIGILPSTTDTDTVAYPVTIDLADDSAAPEGVGASVEIVTSTVDDAVTVPSSAVTNTGRTTVTVLEDGLPSTLPVTVGVVGPSRTSITEGLEPGQQVVLADLDAALPGDDTGVTTGPGGLGGRPGGAGIGGRGVRPQRPN